jgi:hypothetical protein
MTVILRILIAIILPLWAIGMITLGVEYTSAWWIIVGVTIGTNPFTGTTGIMSIDISGGFGFNLPDVGFTVTFPTVPMTSPTP